MPKTKGTLEVNWPNSSLQKRKIKVERNKVKTYPFTKEAKKVEPQIKNWDIKYKCFYRHNGTEYLN